MRSGSDVALDIIHVSLKGAERKTTVMRNCETRKNQGSDCETVKNLNYLFKISQFGLLVYGKPAYIYQLPFITLLVMVKMATEVRPLCRVVCVVVVSTSEFQSETFGLLKF